MCPHLQQRIRHVYRDVIGQMVHSVHGGLYKEV